MLSKSISNKKPLRADEMITFETEAPNYDPQANKIYIERVDSGGDLPVTDIEVNPSVITMENLVLVNHRIRHNYQFYFVCLLLALGMYIAMLVLFWTSFVDPSQWYVEEKGYMAVILLMSILWLTAMVAFVKKHVKTQTIFILALLFSLVASIIVVIADFAINRNDSIDAATDPRVMLALLIVFPLYILWKGIMLRQDLLKRQMILDVLSNDPKFNEAEFRKELRERSRDSSRNSSRNGSRNSSRNSSAVPSQNMIL